MKSAMMLALAALTIAIELAGWALGADAQQRAPPASQPQTAEGAQRQHLHSRGMELLARGDLDAARKYFERAADAGHAQSAVALAETYDPYEFSRLKVFGPQPNLNMARKWYLRAQELGVNTGERLHRLEGR
jgi:TPR repeat protein